MSQPASSGPDWTPILGGIAALLTAAGGVWAIVTGAFRAKKSDEGTQSERTLGEVWRLIEQLQEERDTAFKRIAALEGRIGVLEARIAELELALRRARNEVEDLKQAAREKERE